MADIRAGEVGSNSSPTPPSFQTNLLSASSSTPSYGNSPPIGIHGLETEPLLTPPSSYQDLITPRALEVGRIETEPVSSVHLETTKTQQQAFQYSQVLSEASLKGASADDLPRGRTESPDSPKVRSGISRWVVPAVHFFRTTFLPKLSKAWINVETYISRAQAAALPLLQSARRKLYEIPVPPVVLTYYQKFESSKYGHYARNNWKFVRTAFLVLFPLFLISLMFRSTPDKMSKYYRTDEGAEVTRDDVFVGVGGFDMEAASKLWSKEVGCEAFRKQHEKVIRKFSKISHSDSQEYDNRFPHNPSLQPPNPHECNALRLSHVRVFVPSESMSGIYPYRLEGHYVCGRCGITCQLTWSRTNAFNSDAHLHVYPHEPNSFRTKGHPLRVYVNLEPWAASIPYTGRRKRSLPHAPPSSTESSVSILSWLFPWTDRERYEPKNTLSEASSSAIYANLPPFEIGASLSPESDLQLTYFGFDNTLHSGIKKQFANVKNQTVPLFRASSHCQYGFRSEVASSLLSRIEHHSFGACENNVGGLNKETQMYPECEYIDMGSDRMAITDCVMSHYKFQLAVENMQTPHFVTKKMYDALLAGTVPIYFGAQDAEHFMPPNSFIDGRKFQSLEELAAHVHEVNQDPIKYMDYFAWRTCGVYGNLAHTISLGFDDLPCRLCEAVSAMNGKMHK